MLLVGRNALPVATARELQRLDPKRVVVLGGTGAVSAAVESALRLHAPAVSRIAGADRYATAAAVARSTAGTPGSVFLATGGGFADALTGGPAAAAAHAPVLLVSPTCIPSPVSTQLQAYGYPPLTLLGGTAVLSAGVAALTSCGPVPDGLLTPGVTLTTLDDPRGPWKGKIVTIAPSAVGQLHTVLAQNTLSGLETTTSMARRTGALVAINGDYALPGGRPMHPFAKDGRLLQTAQVFGRSLALDASTDSLRLGPPAVKITLTVAGSGQQAPISKINSGASGRDALALTTREAGTVAAVPSSSCAARIRPRSAPVLTSDGRTAQSYDVREVSCGAAALPPGDDVLTAPLDGIQAPLLRGLQVGTVVTVSWSLGWRNVLDSLGGNPTLITQGAVVPGNVDGTTPYFLRNPRTAVGYRADGTVLLVTVDGRESDNSAGMSLRELAELFVRLGATEAIGLDGGGSTTMVVNGELQNSPSDGTERPVCSALVLVPAQPRAAALRTSATSAASAASVVLPVHVSSQEQALVERQVAGDPGSTGGLEAAFGPAR